MAAHAEKHGAFHRPSSSPYSFFLFTSEIVFFDDLDTVPDRGSSA
ncbi:hypothetical protein [Streptomyces plumbiresistens]